MQTGSCKELQYYPSRQNLHQIVNMTTQTNNTKEHFCTEPAIDDYESPLKRSMEASPVPKIDVDPRAEMRRIMCKEKEWAAMKVFYAQMNKTAKALGISNKVTNFAVAHGMHHDRNYSSAMDMAILSCNAMKKHLIFREVVSTKKYECASRSEIGHTYKWENTN